MHRICGTPFSPSSGGFPDKLVVFTYDRYVVALYGNEDLVNTFRDKLTAAYGDAVVAYDEAII